MTDNHPMIPVEVAYALPDKQKIIALTVPQGTTARQVVDLSGIANDFPGMEIDSAPLGIFGQALGTKGVAGAERYEMQPGDRVEIYRPLLADPKEVRKQRAAKARAEKR